MATPTNNFPAEVYGVFSDAINQGSVQRIFQTFGVACNNVVRHIHILFQSSGGFVADGIGLYNFFRAVPIEVTLYNSGSVQSIATVAYLGARNRKVSVSGSFQVHHSSSAPVPATAIQLQAITEGIQVDDARTEAILRRHLRLPDERWTQLGMRDMTFGAEQSVEWGFADEIAEFSIPPDVNLFGSQQEFVKMPIGGDLSALLSPGKLGVAGGPPARSEEAGPCRTARPMRVVGRLSAKGTQEHRWWA
jgi:ATP-dependent Clp protease, protease subunit